MTLRRFFDDVSDPGRSLVVLNRTSPDPIQRMLGNLFEHQPVPIEEVALPDGSEDLVVVVEDGSIIAQSPLEELHNAILLINSDLFITGARDLAEIELPDALKRLDDVPFTLRGYPASHSEKLLLILLSRYIERTAWERGEGTLRASFQELSRIEDEVGTNRIYRTLDTTAVDVHVYGAPGWEPPRDSDITTHAGYSTDFLKSWFVVYTSPGETEDIGLLALEEAPNRWSGFWTYDQSLIEGINEYVMRNL
ncbi:DICT sensory domain-containing protein [Halobellus captivus]|uniref:DICT sensory domain-containing protein n=1 Tax=Halobellus captivus TaxID=2592614 RepID=UPI0011AAF87A|nr:DICT sensory domain-containing protein [Halobellus captivus]